jgi:Glycosyltransferase family 87
MKSVEDAPATPRQERRARTGLLVQMGGATSVTCAALLCMVLGYADKLPCRLSAWHSQYENTKQFQDFCYSDIYPLYYTEGLSKGQVPYTGHPVEYPVLTGWTMQLAAWLVRGISPLEQGFRFFDVTCVLLALCGIVGILATAYAAGPDGRWQAIMVAFSPALILSAFINWDLLAMALGMLGIAAWAGRRGVLAGVLLGLAVAAKFYPLVIFGPLLVLSLRTGQLRAFAKTLAAGIAAWAVVNVPIAIIAFHGWSWFYVFSKERGADWGSIWYYFEHMNVPLLGNSQLSMLNFMSGLFFVVGLAAICWLALAAPRRPRLPQLCYLVLAAFLITNKVWSPQYVVWLVPLAVLARPRLWPYALWQLAEIGYFLGVWSYLLWVDGQVDGDFPGWGGISTGWYFTTLLLRLITVLILAGYIVRDILRPEQDVVRRGGTDDPAGGIFDGAPDRFVLSSPRRSAGLSAT